MWQKLEGFSDYMINEHGDIFRISTKSIIKNKKVVALKNDSGLWKNRSVPKMLSDLFEVYSGGIVATSVRDSEYQKFFYTIKEAAEWLRSTKQAISAGKLAAYQTVRTNIKHGIAQPDLYPYVYGYSWKLYERS